MVLAGGIVMETLPDELIQEPRMPKDNNINNQIGVVHHQTN